MSEYVTGTDEEMEHFQAQLAVIYEEPHVVLIGSFGRQALYETFGWNVEPITLRKPPLEDCGYAPLRDIDVLGVGQFVTVKAAISRPHLVDSGMQTYIEATNPPSISQGPWLKIDPSVFEIRERQLAGASVRTLLVGTQLEIEQLAKYESRREAARQKYSASFAEFCRFADTVPDNEGEFLDAELYKPFRKFHRMRGGR